MRWLTVVVEKHETAHALVMTSIPQCDAIVIGAGVAGIYQMKLLQNASADAWRDFAQGTDAAWKAMQEAFSKARSHFEKS